MTRRWPLILPAAFLIGVLGCVNLRHEPGQWRPPTAEAKREPGLTPASYQATETAALTQEHGADSSEAGL